ncbi:MAG: protein kinase [Deltaproteobacteria bacterium]|nr:protein kinase [Deltaproteobacteria bacterium]
MATATLPLHWRGRSGRTYIPIPRSQVRHGEWATVRKVIGTGPPIGNSTVDEGIPIALKLWLEADDEALEVLQAEARIVVELMGKSGDLPCPRLYDLIGEPVVTGLVMEWCPGDLERWWRDKLDHPDAFGRLMAAMAEVSRRVSDYHVFYAQKGGVENAHGDLKPGNILMSMKGRWLISDFGAAQVLPPQDSPWATSDVVLGTENFLAPELLFHASKRHPAALDTWALGAILFALLRLQRMVIDGEPVPRNGTASPRFRMTRVNQVLDIYRQDPTRFIERDIDPTAFPDPLLLPSADRRAIQECVRGVLGEDHEEDEQKLAESLLEVLDSAMSIEPAHRFTAARDLAAGFESLTREFIAASALAGEHSEAAAVPDVVRELDAAVSRADTLEAELVELRNQLRDVEELAADEEDTEPNLPRVVGETPSVRLSPVVPTLLVLILLLQVVTLIALGMLAGAVFSGL